MKRIALLAVAVSILGFSGTAHAREKPYCIGSTGYQTTYVTCGYATFEQCTSEALSMRGWCFPNPYYRGGGETRADAHRPNPRPRRSQW